MELICWFYVAYRGRKFSENYNSKKIHNGIGIFLKDSIRPNHDSKDFGEIMISWSYGSTIGTLKSRINQTSNIHVRFFSNVCCFLTLKCSIFEYSLISKCPLVITGWSFRARTVHFWVKIVIGSISMDMTLIILERP